MDCVGGLAKIQEEAINQQSRLHQNKLDGLQSIHFTTENFLRRVATQDGQSLAPSITPLARMMLSSKKKDVSLELFMLELNARGIRCQITPAFLDALFSGNIASKSTSEIPNASSFGCAVSMVGTRLEDIDVALALRREESKTEMSAKEKAAVRDDTILICVTAGQLTKVLNIVAAAFESYLGVDSLLSAWHRGWADFVKEEEDFIAETTRLIDNDLPAKIQSLVTSVAHDYMTEARFFLPNDAILDTDDLKRSIKRRYCPTRMLPAIQNILHPATSPHASRGGPKNPQALATKAGPPARHTDSQLKVSQACFRAVIQKQGLFLPNVPKPMFNSSEEECAKYLFTGLCMNKKCKRKASHTPPTAQRKANAAKFKAECLARYNAAKGPSDPDF
jgi:hypothetical protein